MLPLEEQNPIFGWETRGTVLCRETDSQKKFLSTIQAPKPFELRSYRIFLALA